MGINADKEAGVVVINLSKDFYDIRSVERCCEDFSGLCSSGMDDKNKERLEITLKARGKVDVDRLGYEFCNYLLASMKNENIV